MIKALAASIGAVALLLAAAGGAPAQKMVGEVISCEGGKCQGTNENDTIVASNAAEKVIARAGDDDIELDVVFAGGENDIARGGRGADCIDGGGGGDLMIGGPGDDNRPCEFSFFVNIRAGMTGGPGNDTIKGGPGADSMDGIFDDDLLLGGRGKDVIDDSQGMDEDRLGGGKGADVVNAADADGNDVINGGAGRDRCLGDAGDTYIKCEDVPNGESE